MAKKNIGNITDDLSCPICHQVIKHPVVLQSCGHNFCRACLQGQWGDMEGHDKTCPICKETLPADMYTFNIALVEKVKEPETKEMVRKMMDPQDISDQLTCTLCNKTFRDPVFLKTCRHNFCHECVQKRSTDQGEIECPVCKLTCPRDGYVYNRVLANLLDRINRPANQEEGQANDPMHKCEAHKERITLFCLNDETLCCLVCRDSFQHQSHKLLPLTEASNLIQGNLFRNIQKQLGIVMEVKNAKTKQEQKITEHKAHKQQLSEHMTKEFEKLRKFLDDAQKEHRQQLDATYDPILKEMERNMENLVKKKKHLEKNLEECQKKLVANDVTILQDIAEFIPRHCKTGQIEENITVMKEKPPEGLFKGPFQYYAWKDMLSIVQPVASPLTLDPETAHRNLLLSDDLTRLSYKPSVFRRVVDSPKRFSNLDLALTSEGFNNGRHYWEVDIDGKKDWDIGLMKETLNRKETDYIFLLDLWGVSYNSQLGLHLLSETITILGIYESPRRVGVYLDYDGGQISFYDVQKKTHLCSFSATFTGRLYPYLGSSKAEDAQMNMVHIRL
ncbi:zinc-binding protein A33-like isoform X1 [Ranitomeya variabilis]|uniref:zinc-binding protein A33-like isoform X1 n=1 Tax=Ranitomeya variabilis TaxID=490064 RepID=UPI00405787DC